MSPLVRKLRTFCDAVADRSGDPWPHTQDGPDQRAGTVSSDASDMTGGSNAGSHEVTSAKGWFLFFGSRRMRRLSRCARS